MTSESIQHTTRQVSRAKITATRALAAPEGEWPLLKTAASEFLAKAEAFETADADVRRIQLESKQEVAEGSDALEPLARTYDGVRAIADARLGTAHAGSSTFNTPDDLMNGASELVEALETKQDEEWTAELFAALNPALAAAVKERSGASEALKALQKAQSEGRAAACGVSSPRPVDELAPIRRRSLEVFAVSARPSP